MVYNAMKLFMEINPQLFDDCSHDYTETQNSAEQRQADRQARWDHIAEQAERTQNGLSVSTGRAARPKVGSPMRIDEDDTSTHDSQKRLDALRLQDDTAVPKDYGDGGRRIKHERQSSVGSSRSQR
jgi:serine/threonine-protein phosphatase 2A regulatory subunit B'